MSAIKDQLLSWESIYSETELPDRHGRWARKCIFKDRNIGRVSRVEHNGIIVFRASVNFPCNGNDLPWLFANFESFKAAKEYVEYYWSEFIKICN